MIKFLLSVAVSFGDLEAIIEKRRRTFKMHKFTVF